MINHLRTLLRNLDGDGYSPARPGDEYAPPDFRAVALPAPLRTARTLLFGSDPDPVFLNYRLQQYLTLLMASPLAPFVTAADGRVTYDNQRADFLDDSLYRPVVSGVDASSLTVFGVPQAPDATGRMTFAYTVTSLDNVTATVTSALPPFVPATFAAPVVSLFSSGYQARLTAASATGWNVTIYNRPQWDLGQILANLTRLSTDATTALFGKATAEPYRSWRNLWEQSRELPLQLGAILLALAYRTDERRSAGAG